MKKKFMKFLIAASLITVFASFATLAASITIEENSEVINTATGEVSINFTTSEDMEDTDQITALVCSSEASSEPAEADVFYIDQNTKGTYNGTLTFEMKEEATPGETYTLRMSGTGVANADEYVFTYEDSMRKVTIGETTGNGIVEFSTTAENSVTVEKGTEVYLNVTPAIGYYISSIKKNGAEAAGSIDAYRGGTYKYEAFEDAEFTVTFEEITNVTDKITEDTGMTGMDALTLPEIFKGKNEMEDKEGNPKNVTVAVVFGQVESERTPVEWGIYLTYQDGTQVTTQSTKVGPYFKADDKSTQDNQFGVMFSGLNVGEYYAQTYVKYSENDISLGIKVPFAIDTYEPVN